MQHTNFPHNNEDEYKSPVGTDLYQSLKIQNIPVDAHLNLNDDW